MTPIHRALYRAQARPGQAAAVQFKQHVDGVTVGVEPGQIMTISVFRLASTFFVYWESVGRAIAPSALFGDMRAVLEDWPGEAVPRSFVPMTDIFHCQTPASVDHWRRTQPIERWSGRVARLKPEMASSYIFYHYQLQEERPGSFDKYGLICLHETLMFFYMELPSIVETPSVKGKLATNHTPDHWQDVMNPHFERWTDAPPGQDIWRDAEWVAGR